MAAVSNKKSKKSDSKESQKFCTIRVRVSPKSLKGEVVGWMDDGALKVRVQATPEGGRANIELLRVVAEALGLPVGNVTLDSGSTSTFKILRVSGLGEEEVKRRLSR
ncbi:MAG: DUF167 domain-containing protein [bacterium]